MLCSPSFSQTHDFFSRWTLLTFTDDWKSPILTEPTKITPNIQAFASFPVESLGMVVRKKIKANWEKMSWSTDLARDEMRDPRTGSVNARHWAEEKSGKLFFLLYSHREPGARAQQGPWEGTGRLRRDATASRSTRHSAHKRAYIDFNENPVLRITQSFLRLTRKWRCAPIRQRSDDLTSAERRILSLSFRIRRLIEPLPPSLTPPATSPLVPLFMDV